MRIGGKQGRRPFLTPSSSGLGERVNARLEHMAAASNVRHAEALKVDGVRVVIYNKESGSRLCTCTRQPSSQFIATSVNGGVQSKVAIGQPGAKVSDYSISGLPTYDDPFPRDPQRSKQRITETLEDRFNSVSPNAERDAASILNSSPAMTPLPVDNLNAEVVDYSDLNADADILQELQSIRPFKTGDYIKCPVCVGSSFIDSWQPFKGRRIVLEFSGATEFELTGSAVLDDSQAPNMVRLDPGASVDWQIKLPKHLYTVLRVQLWNGFEPLTAAATLTTQALGSVPLTAKNLMRMNGIGGDAAISVDALDSVLKITHLEIQFVLSELPYGQVPPLDLPYDHDYVDYNANLAIEMGADVFIDTGSILCESKYNRVWRVSNVNRRSTAQGRGLGVTTDVRSVLSQEVYFLLNPFMPVTQAAKLFRGTNEKWQGG